MRMGREVRAVLFSLKVNSKLNQILRCEIKCEIEFLFELFVFLMYEFEKKSHK